MAGQRCEEAEADLDGVVLGASLLKESPRGSEGRARRWSGSGPPGQRGQQQGPKLEKGVIWRVPEIALKLR